MIVAGWSQKKASTPCSPRQSPVENSPGKNEIPTIKTTDSGGCCRRLNDGAGKGSIASKKENQRRQPSGSELRSRVMMAVEIAQAVRYLHEQKPKVIHRDLKPSNIIFFDGSNHVRVVDSGHARFLDDSEMALTCETGTYVYMAPEVVEGKLRSMLPHEDNDQLGPAHQSHFSIMGSRCFCWTILCQNRF
ncbi:hypothetical protein OIU85_017343 [Salix viminalis]|uniref:Protein kinase domain-containing protein n=1 Tax=Salix viminalis TaxID=40686 RepID=A0A9Q0V971_SALVM|nr:hypothetical protein OIU85_017343 [Salix viminalis]